MLPNRCMEKGAEKAGKIRTTLYIDPGVWKMIRQRALDEGRSASQIIEELLRKKLGDKK